MRATKTLAVSLLLAMPVAAIGQTVPGTPPQLGQPIIPAPPGPSAPGPVPPEQIQPPDTAAPPIRGSAIIPPNVDPGMNKLPPPAAGAPMPVIPPPGSPGSNSNVVPK
jgi:hypothetical protein